MINTYNKISNGYSFELNGKTININGDDDNFSMLVDGVEETSVSERVMKKLYTIAKTKHEE